MPNVSNLKRKGLPTEQRLFSLYIKPFMEVGRYYTAPMLEHDIPLRYRKDLYMKISRVLSGAYNSGFPGLEREDTRKIHFYHKYHKHALYAYRLAPPQPEEKKPEVIQTRLPIHGNTVHDIH